MAGNMGFPISMGAVNSGIGEGGVVADDAALVDNATTKRGRRVMRLVKNMAS